MSPGSVFPDYCPFSIGAVPRFAPDLHHPRVCEPITIASTPSDIAEPPTFLLLFKHRFHHLGNGESRCSLHDVVSLCLWSEERPDFVSKTPLSGIAPLSRRNCGACGSPPACHICSYSSLPPSLRGCRLPLILLFHCCCCCCCNH